MKIIIVDYSNEGILYVGDGMLVANYLKRGLVDTDTKILMPNHVGYEKITKDALFVQNKHYWINRAYMIKDLPPSSQNAVYTHRRQLIKWRYPCMEKLMQYVSHVSRKTKLFPWDGFENNLELSLQRCDPDKNLYCDNIHEYSQICGLDAFSAYREIKLQVENLQSIKMRIYAMMQHFIYRINEISSEESKTQIEQDMINRFYRDTSI